MQHLIAAARLQASRLFVYVLFGVYALNAFFAAVSSAPCSLGLPAAFSPQYLAWFWSLLFVGVGGFVAHKWPTAAATRHVLTLCIGALCTLQPDVMPTGYSGIPLRIEGHFIFFVVLVYLAQALDVKILWNFAGIVGLGHFLMGLYAPLCIYGVPKTSWTRALIHAGFVGLQVVGLHWFIRHRMQELKIVSMSRQAEMMIRALDGFALVAITDTRGTITYANEQFCKVAGYPREELLGKDHRDVVNSGYHSKEFWREMWGAIQRGEVWRGEIRNRTKTGKIYWVDTVITPIYSDEGVKSYLAIRYVITEKKAVAEREKELLGKYERANKELEAFSYAVSHDTRAPLRHIVGFIGLLKKALPETNAAVTGYLKIISDSAENLGHMIDGLLKFSRLGKAAMTITTVDMKQLAQGVINLLAAEWADRAIRWKIGDMPLAQGDAMLLKQVYQNLISNALKFIGSRPAPTIEIGFADGAYYVKDNGAGFDQATSGKLFQIFQRLHRQEEFPGTGMGLALAKRIIDRHDGRIWAEGKLNEGATFYFTVDDSLSPVSS